MVNVLIDRFHQSQAVCTSCTFRQTSTQLCWLKTVLPKGNTSTFSYLEVIFTKYIKKNIGLLALAYSADQQLSVNISPMIILSKSKSQGKDSWNVTTQLGQHGHWSWAAVNCTDSQRDMEESGKYVHSSESMHGAVKGQ